MKELKIGFINENSCREGETYHCKDWELMENHPILKLIYDDRTPIHFPLYNIDWFKEIKKEKT